MNNFFSNNSSINNNLQFNNSQNFGYYPEPLQIDEDGKVRIQKVEQHSNFQDEKNFENHNQNYEHSQQHEQNSSNIFNQFTETSQQNSGRKSLFGGQNLEKILALLKNGGGDMMSLLSGMGGQKNGMASILSNLMPNQKNSPTTAEAKEQTLTLDNNFEDM